MKKTVSIFFIILANILILAHAVIPHHHHNKMFVAIVNVLDDEAQDLFNHEHGHSHHHDGNTYHHNSGSHHHDTNKEECLMNEAEVAAALKIQTDDGDGWFSNLLSATDNGGTFPLAITGLSELTLTPLFRDVSVRQLPYVACGHTHFVACAKGLRAPPAC